MQQSVPALSASIPPRIIATDIYGNLFSLHSGGAAVVAASLRFNSFQRVTNDLYISTVSSAIVTNNNIYVAKYNSSGQFITCAGQLATVSFSGGQNQSMMTDYNGNVYYATNDSATGTFYTLRDFMSTISITNNVTFKDYMQTPIYSLFTTTLRKMNNNLETQYVVQLSNQPTTASTIISASNICIDRNNYIYIAGTATVSSLLSTPIQSSIPLPQWSGVAGGPYSWPTITTSPATVSISSIITSTTTYSFLIKYK